jgi:hypothetical protein
MSASETTRFFEPGFCLRRVPRAINNPPKEPNMANKKNTTPGIG